MTYASHSWFHWTFKFSSSLAFELRGGIRYCSHILPFALASSDSDKSIEVTKATILSSLKLMGIISKSA